MARRLRIAVNTGGGDAPGLNAVLRAVTLTALNRGFEVFGIQKGYLGLLDTKYLVPLTSNSVRGITHLGGSILGTNNRGNPLAIRVVEGGVERYVDVSDQAVTNFRNLGFDGLIAIGGDGSLKIAAGLAKKGIPIIGVPKTIDNDLAATYVTFGFETAVDTATDAIDKLHSTAESHDRVMVVEVMGRYCGWIALHAGVAGSADVILIPEIPFDLDKVCQKVMQRELDGRHFSMVVCAEGARGAGRPAHHHRDRPGRPRGAARRDRGEGRPGDREANGQGDALDGAGPPAARRPAHRGRPAALPALRRGRGAPGRGRPMGHHGRFRPAGDDVGAAGGRARDDEDGAGGMRHRAHRAGARHLVRRLTAYFSSPALSHHCSTIACSSASTSSAPSVFR